MVFTCETDLQEFQVLETSWEIRNKENLALVWEDQVSKHLNKLDLKTVGPHP